VLAEVLYQRALARFESEQYRRAEVMASAASGAAVFIVEDLETSDELRSRASILSKMLEEFLSTIWRAETQRYDERFLSGSKNTVRGTADREAALFMCDLREAMVEVARISAER